MNTTLHEAAHSDQYNRPSSGFAKTELLLPTEHPQGTYVTPEVSVRSVGNTSLYTDQPVEVDAFRKGNIAGDAVSKLIDLLPKTTQRSPFSPKENINFSGESRPLNEEMQRLSSYFNQAIKTTNQRYKDQPEFRKKAIEILKETKNDSLKTMKLNPNSQFDETIVYNPESIIPQRLAEVIKAKMAPLANQSPRDLQMNNLIRQVQDAKGVGPMQEWLKKTMKLEKDIARDKRLEFGESKTLEQYIGNKEDFWKRMGLE
jgi:hypothetical protein